jgi:hypothetical protein
MFMTRPQKALASGSATVSRLKISLWPTLCILFSLWLVFYYSPLHAETDQDQTWFLDVKDLTISEVLSKLSLVTGIEVSTNKPLGNKRLTKSYVNQTIEQIIKDLLKGVNYTSVWHHGEKGPDSIDIWIFGQGGGGSPKDLSDIRRTNRVNMSRQFRDRTSERQIRQGDNEYEDEESTNSMQDTEEEPTIDKPHPEEELPAESEREEEESETDSPVEDEDSPSVPESDDEES